MRFLVPIILALSFVLLIGIAKYKIDTLTNLSLELLDTVCLIQEILEQDMTNNATIMKVLSVDLEDLCTTETL